ncbi:MAG: transcriptional repressor [Cyclobacteriaceae bacterium]
MTEQDNHHSILRNHSLRITGCRADVIGFFLKEKTALSQGDLEQAFDQYDRVTLYRTLNTFLESGIIHKIPNSSGTATYGLCHETCTPKNHDHNHIHFKCNNCGQIECLEGVSVPEVSAPKGYEIETVNMIVDGICAKCA